MSVNVEHQTAHERTRERLLHTIMQQGPISAVDLAAELRLTISGIRRHLQVLCDEGLVSEREIIQSSHRGRGRPAKKFVAAHDSSLAESSLPRDYEGLAIHTLDYLQRVGGAAAIQGLANERWNSIEQDLAPTVAGLKGTKAKVEYIAEVLSRHGYAASARPIAAPVRVAQDRNAQDRNFSGGEDAIVHRAATDREPATEPKLPEILSVQLCQGNCPVQHAAKQYPQLCEAESQGLSRLLGVPVQRLATLAQGGHSCTTNIPLLEGTPQ